ncbi:MAG: nucleotidyl transferase AbiEii/AbiGii toxin family protein [Planctomycetaceae bacterium]
MFPVDAFRSTLAKIASIFSECEIRFHLTGGIATVAYGEPRMTQDIDIVIENRAVASRLDAFLDALRVSDFLFDTDAVRRAVERQGMFQLLDTVETLKLDLYAREMIPGELNRSRSVEVFEGMSLPMASPADAAASKLVWVDKGSGKSRRDFRKIY